MKDRTQSSAGDDEEKVFKQEKSQNCVSSLSKFLKAISFGKYESKLYIDGESFYSSSFGGIITIICCIIIAFFAVSVLSGIFLKKQVSFESEDFEIQLMDETTH
jgi:hypothetical protein